MRILFINFKMYKNKIKLLLFEKLFYLTILNIYLIGLKLMMNYLIILEIQFYNIIFHFYSYL